MVEIYISGPQAAGSIDARSDIYIFKTTPHSQGGDFGFILGPRPPSLRRDLVPANLEGTRMAPVIFALAELIYSKVPPEPSLISPRQRQFCSEIEVGEYFCGGGSNIKKVLPPPTQSSARHDLLEFENRFCYNKRKKFKLFPLLNYLVTFRLILSILFCFSLC